MPAPFATAERPSSSPRRILLALGLLTVASGLSGGCTWFKSGSSLEAGLEKETAAPDAPADVSPRQKLRWDGGGVIIGETDTLAYTPESFLAAVSELIGQQRFASVQDLVESWPDIALQTLQESEPGLENQQALQMIASIFDSIWCDSKLWTQYVSDLSGLPKRSSEKIDVRSRFWRYLKNHQPEAALQLRITKTLQREHGPLLRAEFHRLESIAAMMHGDHEASIRNLETAISLVRDSCPYAASKLQLLLGEFYRHADRWEDWKSTWQQAVVDNSQLVRGPRTLDPQFWNRAAFLRPAGMGWPPAAIANLKKILHDKDLANTEHSMILEADESVVWFALAWRHLERAEGQNAVLAFKKSEAGESNRHTVACLQFYQARALVAAGQPGAASAILFRLVSDHADTSLADRSKAVLSTMKMQNGSVAQGLNLVQAAIQSVERWPRDERLRAQADYALALLVLGRESEGLHQLEIARAGFENAGDRRQLRQCLWNRAKYFEKTEQVEPFETASARLAELERVMH